MALLVQHCGRIEYGTALRIQEELVSAKIAGDPDDHLLLLEHEHVYTLGRGADQADLLGADVDLGVPTFRVGRGGGVTYHGPGQLVAYPILTLRHGGRDVHRYVRRLEAVLVATCAAFGVASTCRDGLTGVWTERGKIASIGIGVRRWTTLHGVALNVTTDLSYFDRIVTCRMPELRLTSLATELKRALTMDEVATVFEAAFRREFLAPRSAAEEAA